MRAVDCSHDWAAAGMFGPYPVEACQNCNTFALYPVPGYPAPFDVVVRALEHQGCDPRPVDAEEEL